MATAKKLAEQIQAAENEMKQQENRLKELRQQYKAQEGKERTHRLIERGAILESLIDEAVTFTNEQIKTFLEKTVKTEFARKILTQIKEQNAVNNTTKQSPQQKENDGGTGEKSEVEQVMMDGG